MEAAERVRVDVVPAEAARHSYCSERGLAGEDDGIAVEDSGCSVAEVNHSHASASLGTFSFYSVTRCWKTYCLVAAAVRIWADHTAQGS